MGQTVLEMTGIKKSFAGIYALNGIDFSLELGEVHALLGENGAGKSTLIKVLGGIYQPDCGLIKVNGKEVKIDGVPAARANGIGIIHQEIVLVPYLTVAQNLFLGREIRTRLGTLDEAEMNRRAADMISALGVNIKAETVVEKLTIAQQQMEELFRISDRITVIRDGTYVGTKKTVETNANELVAMMVGRDLDNFYVRDYCDVEHAPIALEVKNLSRQGTFENISFSVHKGEILGFAGLVGAGRSEIMEAVFGARPYDAGQIFLNGDEVHFKNPMQAIKSGIALVPEDRKKQGLVLGNSVAFNLTLSSLRFCMNGIAISEKKRDSIIEHYSKRLRIKAASPEIEAGSLSGGNQQKVVLGKWLATKPDVLILDEPTRGVDVNAKYEIYTVINELAKEGIAIIMVSSELPEIINMCDNVCVIRAGKLVGKLEKDQMNQEEIMKYAAGGVE